MIALLPDLLQTHHGNLDWRYDEMIGMMYLSLISNLDSLDWTWTYESPIRTIKNRNTSIWSIWLFMEFVHQQSLIAWLLDLTHQKKPWRNYWCLMKTKLLWCLKSGRNKHCKLCRWTDCWSSWDLQLTWNWWSLKFGVLMITDWF